MTSLLSQTGTKRLTDDGYDTFSSNVNSLLRYIANIGSVLRALDTSTLPAETIDIVNDFLQRHKG